MSDDISPGQELATVTRLPARQVVDAEIVTPEEWDRLTSQRGMALARREVCRQDLRAVTRVTRTVVTHDRTKTAARAVGRHTLHVLNGLGIVSRRVWEARTNARYERAMRAAEARNDWERLERWEALGEQARERRHKRTMAWLQAPIDLLRAVVFASLAGVAVLLALGFLLFAGTKDPSDVLAPIRAVIALVTWTAWAVTIAWGPFVLALPWLVVLALWHVGRTAGVTPAFLAASHQRRDAAPITPSVVVTAVRDLGITELRKRVTALADAGAAMVGPIKLAGCGVEFDITPPRGATSTGEILARHARLAENLGRHQYEVTLNVTTPGTIRVWATDPGALDEPIGPSPLALDDTLRADYRRGKAPWGVDIRGDAVTISLYQRHLLITGASNQGKSRSMMALALWLALDPKVEFRVADLKGINPDTKLPDWEPFRDIATVFIAGPTDDHVIEATEMLEAVAAEMDRRIQEGGQWGPLIALVDEAQVAYMCPATDAAGKPYGGAKNTSRFLTAVRKIQNQGRAVDVLLWQGTQDPTNQNLPVLAREGAHLRMCLAVGKAEKGRMALGDKAADGGAAPHLLRAGIDKGVVVVAGDGAPLEPGQASVTVRTHYIDGNAAEQVADRAKALRGPVQLRAIEEPRDLLADVVHVLGGKPVVRATDVVSLLRDLTSHRDYAPPFNATRLAERLRAEGVVVREKGGIVVIRADRVRDALNRRGEGTGDGR